jgi:LPXTG-site transpeptidase (sortase) family protein
MTLTRKKILPLLSIGVGFVSLLSLVIPWSFSFFKYFLTQPPRLIDPSVVSFSRRGPVVVNVLGIAQTDYDPTSWFSGPPPEAKAVSTKVRYYTLTYPRLEMANIPIEINGTDLSKNAIHYANTSLPGTPGNAVIFGHSALPQFYHEGDPLTVFNPILKAKANDDIYLNFDGVSYHYVVTKTTEVEPDELSVLAQHYDQYELTLITCTPLGTYWHRFVVRAELVN